MRDGKKTKERFAILKVIESNINNLLIKSYSTDFAKFKMK